MGTRCGQLDPGVILYLLQYENMNAKELETLLYQKSGLLGVSGISNDVRDLMASDAPSAKTALDLFVYRVVRETGSLAGRMRRSGFIRFHGRYRRTVARNPCRDLRTARLAWTRTGRTCQPAGRTENQYSHQSRFDLDFADI